MNISNATPIAPAVQLPVINQEAKVRAENAFPRAEEIDTSAQLPQTPDQSRQKANLEASAWQLCSSLFLIIVYVILLFLFLF